MPLSAQTVRSPAASGTPSTPETPAGSSGPALVALVGPPNAGKTTLFNQLTGLRQKVANYPGVTVEKKVGRARLDGGRALDVVDLPGLNGFSARTLDERVTRDVLEGRSPGLRRPDAVVLVVDSSRLEPQLMLVEPVLDLGVPTLLVLNMSDELRARGGSLDTGALSEALGVEVVAANARAGEGLAEVRRFLDRAAERTGPLGASAAPGDRERPIRLPLPMADAFVLRRERVREWTARARYVPSGPSTLSERLDAVFLHRLWGPLVFVGVVLLVFQAIFTWAVPLMDGVEWAVSSSGEWVGRTLPDTWFRALLIDGVWGGVGSVIIFLPQILILFAFLGVLEDSGYMARAAVIADRLMARAGLQGRAFLPLLSAYACAVPAVLAARTVEDERDRMATIFVAPFMTCSARLPVYALLIAAFVPERPLLGPFMGTRAATLFGLYALGTTTAVATAFLLKRTLLRGRRSTFLMELPPYRIPSLRSLGLRMLDRSKIFLKRAGRIILVVAVALWVLAQVPATPEGPPPVERSLLGRIGHVIEPALEPLGFDWRIGVGLVSSLAAREVIVGTLGTIYGIEDADEGSMRLRAALQRDLDLGGAVALLIFFVFALQCMSTVAMVRRETGGWKWPALQWSYMLALAYVGAYLANRMI